MKLFNLFSLLISLILIISCTKANAPDEMSRQIFGKWNYAGSSGGISGGGDQQTYKKDSWVEFKNNGAFLYFEGDKVIKKKHFKFTKGVSIMDHKERTLIKFTKDALDYSFVIKDNQLFLSQEAYDGFSYMFIRK